MERELPMHTGGGQTVMTSTRIQHSGMGRWSTAAYWAGTGFVALVMTATGTADLLRAPAIMEGLAHLGYPPYFATILGAWEVLGAAAIVAAPLPLLQEWAYAGMCFTLTGAALSHGMSGDPFAKVIVPIIVLGAVIASYLLRPHRRPAFAGVAVHRAKAA
jgi:hypothetical protein